MVGERRPPLMRGPSQGPERRHREHGRSRTGEGARGFESGPAATGRRARPPRQRCRQAGKKPEARTTTSWRGCFRSSRSVRASRTFRQVSFWPHGGAPQGVRCIRGGPGGWEGGGVQGDNGLPRLQRRAHAPLARRTPPKNAGDYHVDHGFGAVECAEGVFQARPDFCAKIRRPGGEDHRTDGS